MLYLRLLIGFLNTSLGNTIQKGTFKRHLHNHIKHSVSLFLSCVFYFLEQIKKNLLQNEIKDLTFEVSDFSITFFCKKYSYEGPITYNIHTERGRGGFKICRVFTDSIVFKQHIYCSFSRMGVSAGVKKLVIFCERHNCMIPNVVMFLVLVPVLQ